MEVWALGIVLGIDESARRDDDEKDTVRRGSDVTERSRGERSNDWPQWQGPDRTGMSKETGLLKAWPASGPRGRLDRGRARQRLRLDGGGGRARVRPGHARRHGASSSALNRADGKEVWSKALGEAGNDDRGPGPRGTPTVDGDRLYVLTEQGDLACLKTDGTEVWQRNILRGLQRSADPTGRSASPRSSTART